MLEYLPISTATNSGLLDGNGNYTLRGLDGSKKLITNKAMSETLATLEMLQSLKGGVDKGACYELAHLTEKGASDFGFTSVSAMVQSAFSNLDPSTIGRYRRIGKVFVQKYISEDGKVGYSYREPIPEETSITNLGQILSLLAVSKDKWAQLDSWTEEEIDSVVSDFVNAYIMPVDGAEDGKIHLLASNKRLREEISALMPSKSKSKSKEQEQEQEQETTEQEQEQDTSAEPNEIAREHIDSLCAYFVGNDKALKLLASLAKMI